MNYNPGKVDRLQQLCQVVDCEKEPVDGKRCRKHAAELARKKRREKERAGR